MEKNNQPDDQEQKKRDAARKQRLIDYKLTFTSQHGERVLKDLQRQFMHTKPSFYQGMRTEDALLIDGGKHVLAYIDDMIEADPSGRDE